MLDMTKPIKTRGGLPVRILCTDRKCGHSPFVIIALVTFNDGWERVHAYTKDGVFVHGGEEHELDLVNVPEETYTYFNIYKDLACKHASDDYAKSNFDESDASGVRVRLVTVEGKFKRLDIL